MTIEATDDGLHERVGREFDSELELLRDFFENASVGLHSLSADGTILRVNRAELDLLGYSEDEYVGHNIAEFHADRDVIEDMLERLSAGHLVRDYRARMVAKDGSVKHVAIDSSVLRDARGRVIHTRCITRDDGQRVAAEAVLRDTESRVRAAEQALLASADRLRRAQQAARLGTWEWDAATDEVAWDGVEQVHGVETGSLAGTFTAYIEDVHPEDQPRVVEAVKATAETGVELNVEYRIVWPDGTTHWLEARGLPIPDADGATPRLAGTCQDITERRLAQDERERLLDDLTRANEVKDEFVGLVSHELRSPLTTIYGNVRLVNHAGDRMDDSDRAVALEDIERETERLQRIIENLLLLARAESGLTVDAEPLVVTQVVHEVVERHLQRHQARRFKIAEHGDPRPVVFPKASLEQVIENLVTNAEKYSPASEPIVIEFERDDREVRVRVLDRGVGIGDEKIARLFDAFYRAPDATGYAPGLGIGLTVCKRLVDAQGGRMWARRRDGGGSEFGFALPVSSANESAPKHSDSPSFE